MDLRDLAQSLDYILGEGGPHQHLDHTNLTVVFTAHWVRLGVDDTLTYMGPSEVSVSVNR